MYTLYPAITSQASTTSIASCVIFCLAPGPSPTIYNSFLLSTLILLSVTALLQYLLCFGFISGILDLISGFGFFRLFSSFQTHRVGFSACFSLATPRLLFSFWFQLPVLGFSRLFLGSQTHRVGFSAYFPLATPRYASATVTPSCTCLRSNSSPSFTCLRSSL